jgi:hypothetical protein
MTTTTTNRTIPFLLELIDQQIDKLFESKPSDAQRQEITLLHSLVHEVKDASPEPELRACILPPPSDPATSAARRAQPWIYFSITAPADYGPVAAPPGVGWELDRVLALSNSDVLHFWRRKPSDDDQIPLALGALLQVFIDEACDELDDKLPVRANLRGCARLLYHLERDGVPVREAVDQQAIGALVELEAMRLYQDYRTAKPTAVGGAPIPAWGDNTKTDVLDAWRSTALSALRRAGKVPPEPTRPTQPPPVFTGEQQ